LGGLVGIAANGGLAPSLDVELEELARAYERLRGNGGREHTRAGELGGVIRMRAQGDPDPEPVRAQDGSWTLWCGTVYDSQAGGLSDIETLDGQFVWARYDARRRELQVANDPFGMRSLFVAERGGTLYFSTSALALAAHLCSRPSLFGINVFLRAGSTSAR